MQNAKLIFLFCLLFIFGIGLNAQESKYYPYEIGLKDGYGFIIAHTPSMSYVAHQHIVHQELFFEKSTLGDKPWQERYHFLNIGVSLNHFLLHNPKHLGNATAIDPYLNFNLVHGNIVSFHLKTGLGVGYIEKIFDTQENYKNNAIGSHFNLFFTVVAEGQFKISKRINGILALNFSHFSNTGFRKPNLGINLPTADIGLKYSLGPPVERIIKEAKPFPKEKAHWQATSSFSVTEIYPPKSAKYLAGMLMISREKRLNYKSTLGGGLDLFYNPAQYAVLKNTDDEIEKGWANAQIGLSIYHLLHFGKFGVIAQMGYYLKTADTEVGNFYHIAGGRWQFNKRLSAYFALKTHFAKAEHFSVGLSYQFSNEK